MKELEAINYLDKLEKEKFITINIPITSTENLAITAMYLGKDKDGRYNFKDDGQLVLPKKLIEKGKITIDEQFDKKIAQKIQTDFKLEMKQKHKNNIKER